MYSPNDRDPLNAGKQPSDARAARRTRHGVRTLLVGLLACLVYGSGSNAPPFVAHAASASALPQPGGGSRHQRGDAARAPPVTEAPANDQPTMRYTVIQPQGRQTGPAPSSPPPDRADLTEEERQYTRWAYGVLASLRFHKGEVQLPNAVAKLNLSAGYEYLDVEDGTRVLNEVWGNPPGAPILGLIVPEGQTPFARDSWGIVLRYDGTGHVADGDRERIDFPALLTPLQQRAVALSAQRKAGGYASAKLLGWAALPQYDFAHHVLQWGTMLQFGDEQTRTMNYEIRMLGRRGVLAMSIIANANQYPQIVQRVRGIVEMVTWQPGYEYDAYAEDVDRRAEGGLDFLITGTRLAEPDSRASWWWLLMLLPVGALAAWLHRRISRGQSLLPRLSAG